MIESDLLDRIRTFNAEEKRQLLTFLLRELDIGDGGLLVAGGRYDVWSPYDAADAALGLQKLLESSGEEAGR